MGDLVGGKAKFSDALDFNPHITHHFDLNKEAWDTGKKTNQKSWSGCYGMSLGGSLFLGFFSGESYEICLLR